MKLHHDYHHWVIIVGITIIILILLYHLKKGCGCNMEHMGNMEECKDDCKKKFVGEDKPTTIKRFDCESACEEPYLKCFKKCYELKDDKDRMSCMAKNCAQYT